MLQHQVAQRVYVTDGRARHRGIELSAQGSLAPGLSLVVTGQYLEAIQLRTSNVAQNGKPIINAPRWADSAFMEYRPHDTRLGLSAGVYYTGRRSADVQGRASIAGYALASLGASYDLPSWHGARTRLQVTADNVLDKRYWATAGDANLYPGLPRTVRFAVTTAF